MSLNYIEIKSLTKKYWWIGVILVIFVTSTSIVIGQNQNKKIANNTTSSDNTTETIDDEKKIDCPHSLTYEGSSKTPVADYSGDIKQVSEEQAIQIKNQCPEIIIKAIDKSSSSSISQSKKPTTSNTSDTASDNQTSSSSDNSQQQSETDKPQTISYDSLSMIAPHTRDSDVSRVGPFSLTADSPWGYVHPGLDFMISTNLVPFQAVTEGTITNVATTKENNQMGWHTSVCIDHNPYLVCYNFETFSQTAEVEQQLKSNIFVKNGDKVKQGDLLGKLVYGGDGAHVDFGVLDTKITGSPRLCPEPFFTNEAKTSILSLIHKERPNWNMCH